MSFIEYFKTVYYQKLLTPTGNNPVRNRADGFLKIFELLDLKINPIILETGCMRADHGELNFSGDGASSFLFAKFLSYKDSGALISVDISKENVEYTKKVLSEHGIGGTASVTCEDSVSFINDFFAGRGPHINLLYLDSFDVVQSNPHPSALHHLMELTAAMPYLKSGSLVAVDDFNAFFDGGKTGKGTYVKEFMGKIGAKILHEDYQIIFEMP